MQTITGDILRVFILTFPESISFWGHLSVPWECASFSVSGGKLKYDSGFLTRCQLAGVFWVCLSPCLWAQATCMGNWATDTWDYVNPYLPPPLPTQPLTSLSWIWVSKICISQPGMVAQACKHRKLRRLWKEDHKFKASPDWVLVSKTKQGNNDKYVAYILVCIWGQLKPLTKTLTIDSIWSILPKQIQSKLSLGLR
jgi:hypothetical protein